MVSTKQVVPVLLLLFVPSALAEDSVRPAAQNETLAPSLAVVDPCLHDASSGMLVGVSGADHEAPPPNDIAGLSSIAQEANAFSPALDRSGAAWLATGLALGLAGAFLARRKTRPARALPAPPPVPAPLPQEALQQRAQANPLDAEAQLTLAIRLLDDNRSDLALPRLERAFKLNPADLIVFLQEPIYERHRQDPAVRAMLLRYRRDLDRRLHTGYA